MMGEQGRLAERFVYDESWTRTWQVNRLVLLVKNPSSLFAYWQVAKTRTELVALHFRTSWDSLAFFLHLYDVTHINDMTRMRIDDSDVRLLRQVQVQPQSDHWYFNDVVPGRRYLADFGTFTAHGHFFPLLRSTVVECPPLPTRNGTLSACFRAPGFTLAPTCAVSQQVEQNSTGLVNPHYPNGFDGYSLATE